MQRQPGTAPPARTGVTACWAKPHREEGESPAAYSIRPFPAPRPFLEALSGAAKMRCIQLLVARTGVDHRGTGTSAGMRPHSYATAQATVSAQGSHLIQERRILDLVIVSGIDILDFGLRFVELRLVQLHNRAQAQVVTALRQRQ